MQISGYGSGWCQPQSVTFDYSGIFVGMTRSRIWRNPEIVEAEEPLWRGSQNVKSVRLPR